MFTVSMVYLKNLFTFHQSVPLYLNASLDRRSRGWCKKMWSSPLPTNTSKIYQRVKKKNINVWNNSHQKLTGNWQKDSCTTNVVRKIHRSPQRSLGSTHEYCVGRLPPGRVEKPVACCPRLLVSCNSHAVLSSQS